jgi:DGQHR domain-containing protein
VQEDGELPAIPVEKSAFVLDGQHRLAGLQHRDRDKPPFEVNVSIFVGADIADQAEIFSRVNLAQTKVNKSLTFDLLEYAKEKSPHKVAHDIAEGLSL